MNIEYKAEQFGHRIQRREISTLVFTVSEL